MSGAPEPRSTGLTRRQFWGVLLASLAIFTFAAGPVWRDPWSIDTSVFVSYAAIPPLVLALLVASRRFTRRDFVLDTLTVTLAKFGVTYVAAALLWAISGEPPPAPRGEPRRFPAAPAEPAPEVAPAEAATLEGVAIAAGAPRAGTLVWAARGTEGRSFPTRTDAVEIVDDGTGFVPPVAAVQSGQLMVLRSGDGRLHAIRGTDAQGRTVFNAAVTVPSTPVRLHDTAGLLTLSCAVHEHAGRERPGRLVVLPHPFFATTGADGRFRFAGLPRGTIVLRALDADLGAAELVVPVPPPRPVEITFPSGAAD